MDFKKRFYIFYLFFFAAALSAQPVDEHKHTIWKVDTARNTVYLVGSIHLLKKDNYPLDPVYHQAFADAGHVVFEINPDSMAVPGVQFMMLAAAMCDSGKSLRSCVSDETWRSAEQKTKELGLDLDGLKQFKPWFVATTITAQALGRLGFQPQYGLDMYFAEKAKQAGKKTSGLESIASQLNIFTQMDENMQELLLQQTFEDLELIETELDKIIEAWEKGDADALETGLLTSFTEYPQVYQTVMVDRNQKWLEKIDRFLQHSGNYFIVVGTGHLLGEDGLVHRLKEKGHKVEQL